MGRANQQVEKAWEKSSLQGKKTPLQMAANGHAATQVAWQTPGMPAWGSPPFARQGAKAWQGMVSEL